MVHISVGDLLREEVKKGTPAGQQAKDFMNRGALVPDEVVVTMVKDRMAQDDVQQRGWLLDGYPRSASQAEAIQQVGINPDVFILINVPDSILVERVVGRRLDPVTGEIYHLKYAGPHHLLECHRSHLSLPFAAWHVCNDAHVLPDYQPSTATPHPCRFFSIRSSTLISCGRRLCSRLYGASRVSYAEPVLVTYLHKHV